MAQYRTGAFQTGRQYIPDPRVGEHLAMQQLALQRQQQGFQQDMANRRLQDAQLARAAQAKGIQDAGMSDLMRVFAQGAFARDRQAAQLGQQESQFSRSLEDQHLERALRQQAQQDVMVRFGQTEGRLGAQFEAQEERLGKEFGLREKEFKRRGKVFEVELEDAKQKLAASKRNLQIAEAMGTPEEVARAKRDSAFVQNELASVQLGVAKRAVAQEFTDRKKAAAVLAGTYDFTPTEERSLVAEFMTPDSPLGALAGGDVGVGLGSLNASMAALSESLSDKKTIRNLHTSLTSNPLSVYEAQYIAAGNETSRDAAESKALAREAYDAHRRLADYWRKSALGLDVPAGGPMAPGFSIGGHMEGPGGRSLGGQQSYGGLLGPLDQSGVRRRSQADPNRPPLRDIPGTVWWGQ